MSNGIIINAGGAGGASLNYKVIGGTARPEGAAKENTIWVDTTVDKETISKAETTQLSYYIKDTTGVVTNPSSNTCHTRYFECVEGHQYRFQMDDGTTVLIASFTEVPNTGVAGTVLYGTGKTHGADTLDYTVTAESGVKYLGIYCYDSSANDSIPVLTITDTTIQNGLPDEMKIAGHIFSATQPENPVEGMVWFQTGMSSNAAFNALKKNSIEVYPTGCKQYVVDAWVTKTAKTCINGDWVDWWNGELYDSGNEYSAQTGGWVISGTGSKESNYIRVGKTSAIAPSTNSAQFNNYVDLSAYSTLKLNFIELSSNSTTGRMYVYLYNATGEKLASETILSGNKTEANVTKSVDISSIGEPVFVQIVTYHQNESRIVYADFNKIWAE